MADCVFRTQSIIRTPILKIILADNSSAPASKPSGGGLWMKPDAFRPESWELLPAVKPHDPGRKMPPGFCGDDVDASYCGRD